MPASACPLQHSAVLLRIADVKTLGIARALLSGHQQQDDQHQNGGELRGCANVVQVKPRFVDRGRESVEVKNGNGAKVGQHFHEHQRQTGTNPGSRQWQSHFEESCHRAVAQCLCGLHAAVPLCQKGTARHQVHIG